MVTERDLIIAMGYVPNYMPRENEPMKVWDSELPGIIAWINGLMKTAEDAAKKQCYCYPVQSGTEYCTGHCAAHFDGFVAGYFKAGGDTSLGIDELHELWGGRQSWEGSPLPTDQGGASETKCLTCNGTGRSPNYQKLNMPCEDCDGKGGGKGRWLKTDVEALMSSGTAASDPLLNIIASGLASLHYIHRETSGKSYPDSLQVTPDNIRTYGLALLDEVHEFLKELQWKPWKTSEVTEHLLNASHINCRLCDQLRDTITEEFADILVFTGLFIGYLEKMGIGAEDIARVFLRKAEKNKQRLAGEGDHPGYKDMRHGDSA